MDKNSKMIGLEEALNIVGKNARRVKVEREVVDVRDSAGRVLASDAVSRLELPPFNKSAMDGYAVVAWDERDEYEVVESVAAGQVPTVSLEAGKAVKVMTGAPVPDGAGKVIMVEDTVDAGDGRVKVVRHSKARNICFMGEDVRIGDAVVKAPVCIGPLEIANMASCGIERVEIFRTIRVAVLSTGDEIVDDYSKIEAGKIMDCNGPMLDELCRVNGLEVVCRQIVCDEQALTESAIRDAMEDADFIILSGGVSMGDFDYVDKAMGQVGLEVLFNRVAVKPGKPMTFASGKNKAVFGLPGNPVSVYLMFHLFVMRAFNSVHGMTVPMGVHMPIAADYKRKKVERTVFVPCAVNGDGELEEIDYHGSAHLAALAKADGFFRVDKGVGAVCGGDKVCFMRVR